MSDIPAQIRAKIQEAKDKKLKELDLSWYSTDYMLEGIPVEIFELEQLEKLDLRNNNIKEIPKEISQLKNLKYLDLIENQKLTKIPREISRLPNLVFLGVPCPNDSCFRPWFRKIPQLGLDLGWKKREKIPPQNR